MKLDGRPLKAVFLVTAALTILVYQNCSGGGGSGTESGAAQDSSTASSPGSSPTATPSPSATPAATPTPSPSGTPSISSDAFNAEITQILGTLAPQLAQFGVTPAMIAGFSPAAALAGATPASVAAAASKVDGYIVEGGPLVAQFEPGDAAEILSEVSTYLPMVEAMTASSGAMTPTDAAVVNATLEVLQTLQSHL